MSDMTPPPVDDDTPWQKCDKCRSDLPRNAYYYHRDAQEPSGFRKTCNTCRKKKEKRIGDLEISTAVERYDKMALRLLEKAAAAQSGSNIPHVAEVFERLMEMAGGATGFAQHVWLTFLAAPPGSQQRVKLLSLIKDFGIKTTDTGAAKKPVEMLDDEELELEMRKREARFLRIAGKAEDVA